MEIILQTQVFMGDILVNDYKMDYEWSNNSVAFDWPSSNNLGKNRTLWSPGRTLTVNIKFDFSSNKPKFQNSYIWFLYVFFLVVSQWKLLTILQCGRINRMSSITHWRMFSEREISKLDWRPNSTQPCNHCRLLIEESFTLYIDSVQTSPRGKSFSDSKRGNSALRLQYPRGKIYFRVGFLVLNMREILLYGTQRGDIGSGFYIPRGNMLHEVLQSRNFGVVIEKSYPLTLEREIRSWIAVSSRSKIFEGVAMGKILLYITGN